MAQRGSDLDTFSPSHRRASKLLSTALALTVLFIVHRPAAGTESSPCPTTAPDPCSSSTISGGTAGCPRYDANLCDPSHRCAEGSCPKGSDASSSACLRAVDSQGANGCTLPSQNFCGGCWFSLVALPDTQCHVGCTSGRECLFDCQTEWIKRNRDALRIAYVMHEGDITNSSQTSQWQEAKSAMCVLNGTNPALPEVPYAVARGNHDNTTSFNNYFNLSMFQNWCSGGTCNHHPTAANISYGPIIAPDPNSTVYTAHPFKACGLDWMIVVLAYVPTDDDGDDTNDPSASPSLEFARNLADQNPNTRFIILNHANLKPNGERGPLAGTRIWEDLVIKTMSPVKTFRRNVFFTFNGHYTVPSPAVARRVETDDTTQHKAVFQVMADYQSEEERDAAMPIMTICPKENRVSMKTYSPFFDKCFTQADENEPDFQYEWPNANEPAPDFSLKCGDGVLGRDANGNLEQCDDGNTLNGDCCSSTCTFNTSGTACEVDQNPCTKGTCNGAGTCTENVCDVGAVCGACGVTCTNNGVCKCGS